jgi:hypothetical protein
MNAPANIQNALKNHDAGTGFSYKLNDHFLCGFTVIMVPKIFNYFLNFYQIDGISF